MVPNRKFLTGGALAVLAVLFVAVILISNALFRGARLDLTQNQLYTLSQGTKKIIGRHRRADPSLPVLFGQGHAAICRSLRVYAQRVRDMLDEMVARARAASSSSK